MCPVPQTMVLRVVQWHQQRVNQANPFGKRHTIDSIGGRSGRHHSFTPFVAGAVGTNDPKVIDAAPQNRGVGQSIFNDRGRTAVISFQWFRGCFNKARHLSRWLWLDVGGLVWCWCPSRWGVGGLLCRCISTSMVYSATCCCLGPTRSSTPRPRYHFTSQQQKKEAHMFLVFV